MGIKSGRLTAAIGSSRSGKTQYVTNQIKGQNRVLIWDIKGEYPAKYRARSPAQLMKMVKALAGKPGVIAYTANKLSEFNFFCRLAQSWVKSHYVIGKNCVLIFEETADVTSPGKAPEDYGVILRRYLSYGVDIYAITQRPAESDKTAVGNASIIRVCRLQLARDRKSVASDTGLPLSVIESLKADQEKGHFDYLHADTGRGIWLGGCLTFPKGKPKFTNNTAEKPL